MGFCFSYPSGKQAVSVALSFGKDITDEVIDAVAKSGNVKSPNGNVVNPDVVTRMLKSIARSRPRN